MLKTSNLFLGWLIATVLLTTINTSLDAQTAPVSNKFVFKNGWYKTFEDFKNNQPAALSYFRTESYKSDEGNTIFMTVLEDTSTLAKKVLESYWGVCVDGVPYIHAWRDETDKTGFFVKLHVVGNICYYFHESVETRDVVMNIYHPQTGQLLARRVIQNHDKVMSQKMLRFATGETADFSLQNLRLWMHDDERLVLTLSDFNSKTPEDRLFKTLLIYNDRHPISVQ